MTARAAKALGILLLANALAPAAPAAGSGTDLASDSDPATASSKRSLFEHQVTYEVIATGARRNRKVMGPVVEWVQGVPARPVNSFVWDGDGSDPIEAELIMEINPTTEQGAIIAHWTDEHGAWTYTQLRFIHPEHSSGVRIGTSVDDVFSFINEGAQENVYLHGDTTAGMGILPTVFNHLATWGPADVTLNGQPFINPYELPAPQWLGHMMLTEGVRGEDGTVRTRSGEIYNPSNMKDGAVDPHDLEVHLVFHDERFPRNENIPPLFQFFYHLVFEDVSVRIVQTDEP
jgi:hypothetical protein